LAPVLYREHLPAVLCAGIVPFNTTTFQLNDTQNMLKAQTGGIPYLGRGINGTVLQEAWHFNHISRIVSYFGMT